MINPQAYVEAVIQILNKFSLHRGEERFFGIVARLREAVKDAREIADTHLPILNAVREINPHSFLIVPALNDQSCLSKPLMSEGKLLGDIGYITIPWFDLDLNQGGAEWAINTQRLIASLDGKDIAGWIVDLRWNMGGNMWPMIIGLGPFWRDHFLGAFRAPGESDKRWYYKDGGLWLSPEPLPEAISPWIENPYRLHHNDKPVVVLTGPQTQSAGEAVVVAFKSVKNAVFMGEPTRGFSTANTTFKLSDGAVLCLTTSLYVDVFGRVYGGRIGPDVLVPFDERAVRPSLDDVGQDFLVTCAVKRIKPGKRAAQLNPWGLVFRP